MQQLLEEAGRGLDALFTAELRWTALAAVVVVAAAALLGRRDGRRVLGWPLLVVAAVALGVRERAVLPLLAAAAGWWALDRLRLEVPDKSGVLLAALAMTGLGLFGTLPETQEAVALLAAVAVVAAAVAVGIVETGRVTGPQVGALLGLLVWVCLAGDGQRLRALVGGLLCVAMFAAVAMLADRGAAALLGLHAAVTVAASRWVGLALDWQTALIRSLPVLAVGVVGLLIIARVQGGPGAGSPD